MFLAVAFLFQPQARGDGPRLGGAQFGLGGADARIGRARQHGGLGGGGLAHAGLSQSHAGLGQGDLFGARFGLGQRQLNLGRLDAQGSGPNRRPGRVLPGFGRGQIGPRLGQRRLGALERQLLVGVVQAHERLPGGDALSLGGDDCGDDARRGKGQRGVAQGDELPFGRDRAFAGRALAVSCRRAGRNRRGRNG